MIDEGVIKFDCEWARTPALANKSIVELNRWRRPLFDAGLIGVLPDCGIGFGNISIRTEGDCLFVISGTQTGHLPDITGEHCAEITAYSISENRVTCRGPVAASSESLTHAAIYELDDDIQAVVHIHSDSLWRKLGGVVPTTNPDVPYGTPAMAEELKRLYRETDFRHARIAVMGGHAEGLISIGCDMAEAAERFLAIVADEVPE